MYRIAEKTVLAENVVEYGIEAPAVARRAEAGQFVILIVEEGGERVPFTVCDLDRERGIVRILVQTVGYTTARLAAVERGGFIADFAGPLGRPTDLSEYEKILLVGGGIGCAVIYPQAGKLAAEGRPADCVIGAKTAGLVLFEKGFGERCGAVHVMTDDGSSGGKGFVTDKVRELLDGGARYDCVFAVGPLLMMKAVCDLTKKYGLKTIVSMNTIMVDGTGMCGSCRLTVGGEMKYACVDGPEFDGHLVDFDEAIRRNSFYKKHERDAYCRLTGGKA